jgi:hypothetical protein
MQKTAIHNDNDWKKMQNQHKNLGNVTALQIFT